MSTEPLDKLGWQVATFALEQLRPDKDCRVGSSAVWDVYCRWCAAKHRVPLAFAVFHAEFDKIADAAGIVRRQSGAHVHYDGVRFEGESL